MDENWKKMENELTVYKNTLVISNDKLYVFRNISSDDMDYYYVLQDLNGNFEEHSAVGEIVKLKGFIKNDSYERLRGIFKYNLNRLNQEVK